MFSGGFLVLLLGLVILSVVRQLLRASPVGGPFAVSPALASFVEKPCIFNVIKFSATRGLSLIFGYVGKGVFSRRASKSWVVLLLAPSGNVGIVFTKPFLSRPMRPCPSKSKVVFWPSGWWSKRNRNRASGGACNAARAFLVTVKGGASPKYDI